MKIVLANLPWYKGSSWGVRAGSRWPHIKDRTEENYLPFPFYLAYAAALLKKHGFDIHLIDAIAEECSYADFKRKVFLLNPGLLVAETSTVTLSHDLNFLSSFQARFPIALCGPDIHIAESEFLNKHKYINFALFGEYEVTLLELSQKLKSNSALSDVYGIIYRQGERICKNPPRGLIKNLDWLPWPERSTLPLKRYNDAPGDIPLPCASMWASRGCPYQCSFCLWPQVMYGGNSYRIRSVENVVDEMEYLVKESGFKSIYFDDDTWNIGRNRIIAFCSELRKRGLQIPWAIMARAELMDEELLEIMRKAGLFAVKYGVESSSQEILNNIGKGLDLKKAEEIIKYTTYLGIRTHLTFTFGLPGETEKTIEETIAYAIHLNPTSVQFSLATPFPGTKFYDEMKRSGYILTDNLEKFDGNHSSVIKTAHLTAKQLVKAKRKAYSRWDAHYRIKRKKLLFKQKTLKEKLIASLKERGFLKTALKITRYILRKMLFIPRNLQSFFGGKIWFIEETLGNDNLQIKLGEGQVRIFINAREITKGVGITSSFYYGERWFDSSQANWKLEKLGDNKIMVKLKWDDVPVRQYWDIMINDTNSIHWVSDMEVENPVQLLECKAGIMLQDSYNIWKDELGTGEFPEIKTWEEIELYTHESKFLAATQKPEQKNNRLPDVELYLRGEKTPNTYPQIQNSDAKTKARILQMRKLKIEQFEPGKYHFFDLELKMSKRFLAPQKISDYKERIPFNFIKREIGKKGFLPVASKIIKKLHPKKLAPHYLDILGIVDGSFAYKGPYCVQIDLTNNCNNDCIGCWCNSPLLKDKKIKDNVKQQTLPFEVVKKTIDELSVMGTREIYFAGGGEPFMHPHILEIIEHVKAKGMKCYINTNFTLVSEDIVKRLVDLKVDNLVISVWAGTAKTYLATHPNKSEEMFFQIKGMLKLLNSLKREAPNTNMYNVISNMNYKELEQMVDFAVYTNSNSLEFTVVDTIPDATDSLILSKEQRQEVIESCQKIKQRLEGDLKEKIQILQFDQFLRRISNEDAQTANYDNDILKEMPCYIGWLFSRILADGNVNFCLKAHRIPVGNIYARDFSSIWNGEKQKEFRKRALCASKEDVFFSFIGNDPKAKVGCYKGCDDLARNVNMHKKIQSLSRIEFNFLKIMLITAKLYRSFKERKIRQTLQAHIEKKKKQFRGKLEKDKFSVLAQDDGVKLFWEGKELTQSVGLNTSVCVFGLWYDSSKARWDIAKNGNNELILRNSWRNIPLSQEWRISLTENNSLNWQVQMFVDSKIEIEESKASLMLSPIYNRWKVENEEGKFPFSMNWNQASLKNTLAKQVSISSNGFKQSGLPQIKMDFTKSDGLVQPQIQNSNKIINARIISARRKELNGYKVFLPGNYEYFSAQINIGDDDA